MRVLICGGGVIGALIAYFLSCRGVQAIVIERTGLACAASSKAGGFLAQDWCDGTPLEALFLAGHLRPALTGAGREQGSGPAGVLPSGHAGWLAADRARPRH